MIGETNLDDLDGWRIIACCYDVEKAASIMRRRRHVAGETMS